MYIREDSYIENEILTYGLYGNWEKESLKIWANLAKDNLSIIDIGANTGIYSLIAQNNNSKAKIIAIEPVDVNFKVLSMNISKNQFPIITEQIALSNEKGTAKMFMLKDRLNYMTSVNEDRYALHPEIKGDIDVIEINVNVEPFSYIIEKYNLDNIDLIKIDVEGHEVAVILGMLPYIEKYKPSILIEIIGNDNASKLDQIFTGLDYEFVSINESAQSIVVDRLWDNDHHNFLICSASTRRELQLKNLIAE